MKVLVLLFLTKVLYSTDNIKTAYIDPVICSGDNIQQWTTFPLYDTMCISACIVYSSPLSVKWSKL